jgi:hypothetical protein
MTLALTDHELDALERKLNAERARRMLTNYKASLGSATFMPPAPSIASACL